MQGSVDYSDAKCVVTTHTYYGNTSDELERRELFLKTVADLAAANEIFPGAFPLVVTDTSPDHEQLVLDVRALNQNVEVLDGRGNGGIGPQTIQSIKYAHDHGAPFVFRIDPEKYGLVVLAILVRLLAYLDSRGEDDAAIVCIGRSPNEGFVSLPPYQQVTERIMSRALASLGLPEDTASGIRLMNRDGMEVFMRFDCAEQGKQWECLWKCLLDALHEGRSLGELFLPFIHPREMVEMETGNPEFDRKRDNQAAMIIPEVVAYAAKLGIYPTWDPNRKWKI